MKLVFIALVITLFSCNKEYSCEDCIPTTIYAVIVNTGPVASDGCGWLIKVDSNLYHPDLLDETFQQDGLQVKIKYELTAAQFFCGFRTTQIPIIQVISIER